MKPSLTDDCKTENTALRVLFFEDDTEDIELTMRALRAADFEVVSEVATTLELFRDKLRSRSYDIVLSDYRMPGTTGLDCLEAMKAEGISIPFILVTGSLGDEKAVECLKEGVADYVLKDRLARLPVAIRRALEEQRLKAAQAQAQEALRRSEASYCSLVQNAPCGILRLDALSECLQEANAALSEMLGYAASSELLEHSAAGGIVLPAEALARLMEGHEQDGRRIACEIEWKRRDGTPLVVGLRGRLLLDPGRA
ncbi:MAG TPA: response regulator, partial [Bryobacteraceae bacterium]